MLRLPFLALAISTTAFCATQLVMLGTGTPRADPDRSGPAVAIVYNDSAYLFDSGPGVVRRASAAAGKLKITALQAPRLNRVFLTHLHSDHTLGLPDLIFSPWTLGRTEPLDIYGPHGTAAMVDHIEAAWQQDIDIRVHGLEHGNSTGYRATVHEIKPGVVFTRDGIEVTAIPVHHGSWPEAFGYRIRTPDRSIVISGDCAPSATVEEACNGCDVLVHEVYPSTENKDGKPDWSEYLKQFHTSTAELAQIATKARPRLLVLYHQVSHGTTDEAIVREVKEHYSGLVISARDLDVY